MADSFRAQLVEERRRSTNWQQLGAESSARLAAAHMHHHAAAVIQRHHRQRCSLRELRAVATAQRTASQCLVQRQLAHAAHKQLAALLIQRQVRTRQQLRKNSSVFAAFRARESMAIAQAGAMHMAAATIQGQYRIYTYRRHLRKLAAGYQARLAAERREAADAAAAERVYFQSAQCAQLAVTEAERTQLAAIHERRMEELTIDGIVAALIHSAATAALQHQHSLHIAWYKNQSLEQKREHCASLEQGRLCAT
eukprot:SAG31_NODE_1042_length_10187_cov_54.452121_10_plen_253_part_00